MRSLVLGAGLIGAALTTVLVQRGDDVTVATRSATPLTGASAIRLDVSDAAALTRVAAGVDTLFVCTNPPYSTWGTEWPPIFAAVEEAAQASGAAVVAMGNMYPYGRARMPMTEHSPELTTESKGLVRKAGWERLRSSGIRAVEVRASDYFGPGSTATAHIGARFFVPILAGRTARVVGDPAAAHSWAYLPDIAVTLAAASRYEGDWGRVWHVPSATDDSRVRLAQRINERFGTTGRVKALPQALLGALGVVNPMVREVYRSSYQFTAPFISDASETQRLLAVSATSSDEALFVTAESYRG